MVLFGGGGDLRGVHNVRGKRKRIETGKASIPNIKIGPMNRCKRREHPEFIGGGSSIAAEK